MIKSRFLTTTVNSRNSTTLEEAKQKGPIYSLIDKLEKAEQKLLQTADKYDGHDWDSAKAQKDLVVVAEKKISEFSSEYTGSLSSLKTAEGYELEFQHEFHRASGDRESLKIQKTGDITTYDLRRGGDDREDIFGMGNDRLVSVTKDTSGEGEPTYTINQGRMGIMAHGLSGIFGSITSLIPSIPSVSINFGGKSEA